MIDRTWRARAWASCAVLLCIAPQQTACASPPASPPPLTPHAASLPEGLFRLWYDAEAGAFVNYGTHRGSVGITAHDASPGLLAGPVDGSFRYTVREEVKLPRFTLDYQTEFTFMAWIRPEKRIASMPFLHSASTWVDHDDLNQLHSYFVAGDYNPGLWLNSENPDQRVMSPSHHLRMDDHEWKHIAYTLGADGVYRYYENGVQKATHTRTTTNARLTDIWYLGYQDQFNDVMQFYGSMYDFYLNPSVGLTQSQLDAYIAASAPQESLPALPSSFASLPTGLFRLAYDASTSSFVNHGRHGQSVGITAHDASPGLLAGPVDGSFRYTVREEVELPRFTLDYQTEFTLMAWIRPEKQATYSAPFVFSASTWAASGGHMHTYLNGIDANGISNGFELWLNAENAGSQARMTVSDVVMNDFKWKHVAPVSYTHLTLPTKA